MRLTRLSLALIATIFLLSGCLEFAKAPFSENDFVPIEKTKAGRDLVRVLSKATSSNSDLKTMLGELRDSVDAVVVDDMFLVQEEKSGKWQIYILTMSKTHIFVCMPMDLEDYQFPGSVSVSMREEMGKIYKIDGPQSILKQVAEDVARTTAKICTAIPISKQSTKKKLSRLEVDQMFREHVIEYSNEKGEESIGSCIASKSPSVSKSMKEAVINYGLDNPGEIKDNVKEADFETFDNLYKLCKEKVKKSEVREEDPSRFDAIVGEWIQVEDSEGEYFSVDENGQVCFKEHSADSSCHEFTFIALGSNRFGMKGDDRYIFEFDGNAIVGFKKGEEFNTYKRLGGVVSKDPSRFDVIVGEWIGYEDQEDSFTVDATGQLCYREPGKEDCIDFTLKALGDNRYQLVEEDDIILEFDGNVIVGKEDGEKFNTYKRHLSELDQKFEKAIKELLRVIIEEEEYPKEFAAIGPCVVSKSGELPDQSKEIIVKFVTSHGSSFSEFSDAVDALEKIGNSKELDLLDELEEFFETCAKELGLEG